MAKVFGEARYVDDLTFPGMIHGATVRSPVARGILKSISFDPTFPWEEFTIVTANDIPGRNEVALILNDQPCLANKTINHIEEPILLLAHPDRYLLEEARRAVSLKIEPLPAVFTLEDSLNQKEIIWAGQILKAYHLEEAMSMLFGKSQTSSSRGNTTPDLRSSSTSRLRG